MNSEDPTRGHAGDNKPLPAAAVAAILRDVHNNIGPHQSSQQPQQRQNQHQSSSFLPEPFPTAARANSKCHFHDAFGESDSGVDYGPPNEYEDGNDGEGGNEAEEIINGQTNLLNEPMVDNGLAGGEIFDEVAPERNNTGVFSSDATIMADQTKITESINLDATSASAEQFAVGVEHFAVTTAAVTNAEERIISLQELEEEVGLHEATLESLTLKLQNFHDEIQREQQNSSALRKDVQLLHQRKLIFNKRTDNNLKLVKDLEASLERCLERLSRALDAQDDYHDAAAQMMPGDSESNQHE